MARDNTFHDFVMSELFANIEGIRSRPMFGGWGIYKDDTFFALISNGQLFFKVGNANKTDYQKYDSKPFVYTGHKGKDVVMSYWELPADIMDEHNELIKWVDKSISVAKVKK